MKLYKMFEISIKFEENYIVFLSLFLLLLFHLFIYCIFFVAYTHCYSFMNQK
jgi:hypothetical protein